MSQDVKAAFSAGAVLFAALWDLTFGLARRGLAVAAVAIAVSFALELWVLDVPRFTADTTSAIAGALAAYVGRK